MKNLMFWAAFAVLGLCATSTAGQSTNPAPAPEVKETTFKVYGNCGMCERRIENALATLTGVKASSWDADTKMVTVQYDDKAVSPRDLHAKVASVGHDTDEARAPDDVYAKLHGCCKYERPAREN